MRSVAHGAGTANALTTSNVPKGTYVKLLVTSDPVVRGRGHVQTHYSANPTIDFRTDYDPKWSIEPYCNVNFT